MAGFLYYLQHREPSPPSLEKIRDVGLGHAFDRDPVESVRVKSGGPDGGEGCVLGYKSRMGDWSIGYRPAEQRWHEMPCGAWLGWWTDAPPTPEELARPRQLPGYEAPLNDGHEWLVPLIRCVDDAGDSSCGLPAVWDMTAAGDVVRGGPVAKHKHLWDDTAWYWEALTENEPIDQSRAIASAGLVLSANYYASAFELCKLGVFSEDCPADGVLMLSNQGHIWLDWAAQQEANHTDPKKPDRQPETSGGTTSAGRPA